MVLNLCYRAALAADEELRVGMFVVSLGARHKGVQPLNPVHQPVFDEKIQRPVDGGRHGRFTGGFKLVEQLIRRNRCWGAQDQIQHFAAQGGELRAIPGAKCFRRRKLGGNIGAGHGLYITDKIRAGEGLMLFPPSKFAAFDGFMKWPD